MRSDGLGRLPTESSFSENQQQRVSRTPGCRDIGADLIPPLAIQAGATQVPLKQFSTVSAARDCRSDVSLNRRGTGSKRDSEISCGRALVKPWSPGGMLDTMRVGGRVAGADSSADILVVQSSGVCSSSASGSDAGCSAGIALESD